MKLRAILNEMGSKLTKTQLGSPVAIQVNPEGYSLYQRRTLVDSLLWRHVVAITAFKRDLLTEDQICLRFECEGEIGDHEVNEDMKGFENLVHAMCEAFQNVTAGWREAVVQPAFAPQTTVLWRRN